MDDNKFNRKDINYRQVESCPNCLYCDDMGIDEEALRCKIIVENRGMVDHDCICDKYDQRWTKEKV